MKNRRGNKVERSPRLFQEVCICIPCSLSCSLSFPLAHQWVSNLGMWSKDAFISAWGETKGVFTVFSYPVISLNPVFDSIYRYLKGFPGSTPGKESACNAGDPGWIPELGRSSEEGIGYPLQYSWASLVAQMVENLPAMLKPWVWFLGWEDSLEEGMATHSSILAWRIPWTEELCGPWDHKESDMTKHSSAHLFKTKLSRHCGLPLSLLFDVEIKNFLYKSERS